MGPRRQKPIAEDPANLGETPEPVCGLSGIKTHRASWSLSALQRAHPGQLLRAALPAPGAHSADKLPSAGTCMAGMIWSELGAPKPQATAAPDSAPCCMPEPGRPLDSPASARSSCGLGKSRGGPEAPVWIKVNSKSSSPLLLGREGPREVQEGGVGGDGVQPKATKSDF